MTNLTHPTDAAAAAPALRPWGLLASLILFLILFEAKAPAQDYVLSATGLQKLIEHSAAFQVVNIIAGWGLTFLLVVLAALLTNVPLADYLGWNRPRVTDVLLGAGVILAIYGLFVALTLLSGDGPEFVADYRGAIAKGMSSWWYVLRYWPAIFLAAFVEESFFRGFMWRGIEAYHGRLVALLVTSIVFAAMHHNNYIRDGALVLPSVIQYLLLAFILGWIRWRSGGTTATIVTHAVNNASLQVMPIVASAYVP